MIAKGNTHDSGPKLVAYILTAQEGERVEFGSARGFDFFGRDVLQAAAIMQLVADHTTNCRDACRVFLLESDNYLLKARIE